MKRTHRNPHAQPVARPRRSPLRLTALEDRTVPALVGRLDPLFDGDGKNSFGTFVGTDDTAAAIAFQPDGRFVVAGTVVNPGGNEDIQILRFNANGMPDNTFAGTGRVFVAFDLGGTNNDRANAVAIQPDGKIVVAGFASTTSKGKDVAVVRLNTNGSLDTNFSGDGKATVGVNFGGNFDDVANAVVIQPDKNILIGGSAGVDPTGDTDFLVVRLTATGALDTTLQSTIGIPGIFQYTVTPGVELVTGVGLQPDGKIIAVGSTTRAGNRDFSVTRITADGQFDNSGAFQGLASGSGFKNTVLVDFGGKDDVATAVHVSATGTIVVAGSGATATSNGTDFALLRLNADGSPDTTFDTDGKLLVPFDIGGTQDDAANAVFVQPDGRIVAAGFFTFGATDKDFAAVRRNADGSADTTYDFDGRALYSFDSGGGNVDVALGAALDPSGRIVLVGTASTDTNGNELALLRVFGQEVPLVVSTLLDEDDGNLSAGKLSLREAITLANLDPDDNAITFAAGLTGTITLGSDLPAIIGNTTIAGPGASKLAVSGNDVNRVFVVNNQSTALINVSISGLTLTRGRATSSTGGAVASLGGAIFSNENLTLTDVAVTDNKVNGAIFQGAGTLTVTGSTFSGNQNMNSAAAILASGGSLAIADSTFSNNSGAGMGAIFTSTAATVSGSTFVGNTASSGGQGGGAAILHRNGPLTVTNSTFSGNTAAGGGGAIRVNEGALTVTNSTFTLNRTDSDGTGEATDTGGGIFVSNVATASAKLVNTIVSGNLIGAGATADNLGGKALEASSSNTLIGVAAGLLPLANNGGSTQTHALLAGSPAVNAGAASALPTDQRGTGFPRSLGGAVDIGAFELAIPANLVVDNAGDADDGNFAAGQLTLREAIGLANARTGADTITFATGLGDVVLTSAQLAITDTTGATTITGPATGTQVVTRSTAGGTPLFRIFNFGTGATANFSGLTISNGNRNNGSGGIFNNGTLTITNSTISGNTAGNGSGGGIANNGMLTITNSTLSGNTASFGSGIDNFGTLTLTNSTLSGNMASFDGGGIRNTINRTVMIANSTLSGNTAGRGGGIFNDLGTVTMTNTIVAGNLKGTTANDVSGAVANTSANNLIGDAANAGGLTNGVNGNIVGVAVGTVLNTALANNGGPTLTHAILFNSPALGGGTITGAPTADQRGFIRPDAPQFNVDIGAYEVQLVVIAPSTLPGGIVGTAYNQQLTASFPNQPAGTTYTFTATGALPAGLSISPAGLISGTPTAGGSTTFSVLATASTGDFSLPTNFTIVGNTIPVAVDDKASTTNSMPVAIGVLTNDSDADGDTVTVTNTTNPANGSIVLNTDQTITYTPNATFAGNDTFTYTIRDGKGGTATANVSVTVANASPVAVDDKSTTASATLVTIDALANDTDANGDTLSIMAVGKATNGTPNIVGTKVTYTPNAGFSGNDTFTYTISDGKGGTATGTVTVTIATVPLLVGFPQFAAGADAGGTSVTLFNPDQSARFTVQPFGSFTGGIRTAAADLTGDGVADLIVGTGPGTATSVQVFDGKSQALVFSFAPFEAAFQGGVYVAAGDVTGDGIAEIIVTPDEGGGPRVRVIDGASAATGATVVTADYFGIDDKNFRGGARASAADITGDGLAEVVVAAGFGGGPRITIWDGATVAKNQSVALANFFAFEGSLRNGTFVTAGDFTGDGRADIVFGGGPGGGPRVRLFDGNGLLAAFKASTFANVDAISNLQLANFFAGNPDNRGGVRLAVKDLDGDTRSDLVVGAGTGTGSRVTAYRGGTIQNPGTPPEAFAFDAIQGFVGGVFVG